MAIDFGLPQLVGTVDESALFFYEILGFPS